MHHVLSYENKDVEQRRIRGKSNIHGSSGQGERKKKDISHRPLHIDFDCAILTSLALLAERNGSHGSLGSSKDTADIL